MAKLINIFTKAQHVEVLEAYPDDKDAALAYSNLLGDDDSVSRQLVYYWRKIFKPAEGTKAQAIQGMKEARKLIKPSPTDDIGNTHIPALVKRALIIGDTHEPYTHQDTYLFLAKVKKEYKPDLVIQMGDETDGHAISFHDSDPNLDSAGAELEKAKLGLARMHALFPNLLLCDSNHGSLVYRRAKAHGLPVQMIKRYREILFPEHHAPGWSWADAWVIQTALGPVRFAHTAAGDIMANAAHERMSTVWGHEHGKYSITYNASSTALYFGAYSGCFVDRDSQAFAYGKQFPKKPILGCMVITDGCPQLIPMLLDSDGRWVGRDK